VPAARRCRALRGRGRGRRREPGGGGHAVITTMAGAAISIVHVSHGYDDLPVLDDVSLEVPAGGRLAVVGPSGCGKSTLLSLVAGLEQPRSGRIAVGGSEPPDDRLARCALIPQDDLLLPWRSAHDT